MNYRYVALGILRKRVPVSLLFVWMRLRGNASPGETSPDASFQTWKVQLDRRGLSLIDKHVLEFGSGRYARFALRILAAGAHRVTLVDPYATLLDDPDHRAQLQQDCEKLDLNWAKVSTHITVMQNDFLALPAIAPFSGADLIMSVATLEHVQDPAQVLECCYSRLRPGGSACHMIDLRDHNLAYQHPFEMLTFDDPVWERWLDLSGGFHLNRWRAPDYVQAMRMAGFVDVGCDVFWRDDQRARAISPRLAPRFRGIPIIELAIQGMYLYGRKPG